MNKLLLLKIICTIITSTVFFTDNIFGLQTKYILAVTVLVYFVLESIIRKTIKKEN